MASCRCATLVIAVAVTVGMSVGPGGAATSGWQVAVDGSSGLLQGANHECGPVLAAATGPLVTADIEFPVPPGDTALELERNWRLIWGAADAISRGPSSIAPVKPATLEWRFSLEKPGRRRLWLLARHSEVGPGGRDQAEAYEVSIDGLPLSGTWRRLAVRNFGNAWLGWLDLAEIELAAGEHRLRITTRQDWCFLDRLLVSASGADPARFAEVLAAPQMQVARLASGGVRIRRAAGPLEVLERIEPVGGALRLTGRLRWRGEPTVLRRIVWRVPLAVPGRSPASGLAFPGALPAREVPLPGVGQRIYPRPRSPLVTLHDGAGRAVSALAYSPRSAANIAVVGAPEGPVIEVEFATYGLLRTGAEVDLDQVLIAPARGGALQAASAFGNLYHSAGLRAPPRRAAWAEDLVIYCAHPGGPIERGFAVPGGFAQFAKRVPALARMGITGLWLLPIFEHGDNPYSIYGPVDQFAVSRRLGTPQEMRALVDTAHRHGIRVLFDFVPHGPPENSALAQQFPDAICLDEEGRRKTRWGWSFDYANARWQGYMHDAAAHCARSFGIDGTRIDVFHGDSNWDANVPYLASYPVLGGGMRIAHAIRSGIAKVRGSAFVLPESYELDPAMWGVAEATYDAGLYFLLEDLAGRDPPPEEWAETLSWWMQLQGRSLPPWGLPMRFLANHDTVLHVFLKARPAAAFGYERSHALAAIITLARGIPMIYEGEEDAALWGGNFPSSAEFYTRLFNLRRRLAPLRGGTGDYRAVRASPGVWTCLRRAGGSWALGVVSLWPQARDVRLTMPADLQGPVEDALAGVPLERRGRSVRLRLPPYTTAVLAPRQGG